MATTKKKAPRKKAPRKKTVKKAAPKQGTDDASSSPSSNSTDPGGRPRAFTDPAEVQRLGDEYLAKCLSDGKTPHIVGMAVHMGVTRETFNEYARGRYDSDEPDGIRFSDTIKMLKERCLAGKLDRAYSGDADKTVFIFDAKNNHGWSDVKAVELTGKDGGPVESRTITADMPADEAAKLYQEMLHGSGG